MKRFALILLPALFSAGCGFAPPYAKVESRLRAGDYKAAVQALEDNKKAYGGKSLLLYYFDRLWAEHLAGNYKASNDYVELADKLIDELYTHSASGEALAFLGNDMSLPYQGENFERVMLHTVGMLNYAMLGETGEALVEARRADQRLKDYVEKAGKDKVVYQEDALSRYLSANLYESQGGQARWDAWLDYKKCDQAFGLYSKAYGTPLPSLLKGDLLRLSAKLGESEAHQDYASRFGALDVPDLKGKGQVIVLFYEGLAPIKVSEHLNLPLRLNDGTVQYFSAAFPKFEARPGTVAGAAVSADGGEAVPLELFQDIERIAIQDLNDRVGLIRLKAIARATAKFQAARLLQMKAREQGGEGAQLLAILGTNLYGLFSEQSDTRSWRTLPARVYLTRLSLAPGKHSLRLQVAGAWRELPDVEVASGEIRVVETSLY